MYPQAQQATNYPSSTFGNVVAKGESLPLRAELAALVSESLMLADSLRGIADCAFGALPRPGGVGESGHPGTPTLTESVSALRGSLSLLRDEVDRLRAL